MNIFEIIDEYLRRSANALLRLREATKHYDLMAAWRNGSLDRMGSVEGIRYEFHGSGVYIEAENFGIEVNFRPGGSIDGFDSWRLWQMIKAEPNLSKVFMSHADVRYRSAAAGRIGTAPITHKPRIGGACGVRGSSHPAESAAQVPPYGVHLTALRPTVLRSYGVHLTAFTLTPVFGFSLLRFFPQEKTIQILCLKRSFRLSKAHQALPEHQHDS